MIMADGQLVIQLGLVLFVMFLAFFLLIRPQLARISEHKTFLASLKIGDHVVMRGGLIGKIVVFENEDVVGFSINPSTTVRIDRHSIERNIRD
jgi:preprotein translocase subunit YajC